MTTEQQLRAKIAELRAQRITVPEGWKVVPIEPTLGMGHAVLDLNRSKPEPRMLKVGFEYGSARSIYAAMLSAAPMPPTAQPVGTNDFEPARAVVESIVGKEKTAEVFDAISDLLPIYEDVYDQCRSAIKPLVDADLLPGSVVESLGVLIRAFSAQPAEPAVSDAPQAFMTTMQCEDGRKGWFINTPDFYADVEPDETTGAWSVFFRDKDGGEGYAEQASQPQQSTPAVPPMPEFEVAGWMHSLTGCLAEAFEDIELADGDSTAEPLVLLSDVAAAWPKGTV